MNQLFSQNPRSAAMAQARQLLEQAVNAAMEKGDLPQTTLPDFIVEVPGDNCNGDIASNLALAGAKSDIELMKSDERFAELADLVGEGTLDDLKRRLMSQRKRVAADINDLPKRFDELGRMLNGMSGCDFDRLDERQAEEYLLRAITAGSCQHALHAVGRQQVVVREEPHQRLARQGDATLPVGHQVAPAQVFRKAVVGDGQFALVSTYNGLQRLGTGIVAHIHGEVPARLCRHRVERLAQEAAFIGWYYDGYLVPHVYFSFSLLCVGRKGMA